MATINHSLFCVAKDTRKFFITKWGKVHFGLGRGKKWVFEESLLCAISLHDNAVELFATLAKNRLYIIISLCIKSSVYICLDVNELVCEVFHANNALKFFSNLRTG